VVRLLATGTEQLGMGSEQATAIVDAGGGFCFEGVPAGSYLVRARRSVAEFVKGAAIAVGLPETPGWLRGPSTAIPVLAGPAGIQVAYRAGATPDAYAGEAPVVAGNDDVTNLLVQVLPAVSISGRVVYLGAHDGLGLAVTAEPANGEPSLAVPPARRQSAEPGRFRIDGLGRGKYHLRLGPGVQWAIRSVEIGGRDRTDTPIDTLQDDVGDVVLTVTDRVATVSGFVRNDQGQPADNCAVLAFPTDRALWAGFGFTPPKIKAAVHLAASGYQIRGLPEAEYFLVALEDESRDGWHDPRFLRRAAAVAEKISLAWGEHRRQDLVIRGLGR
jgi:hypothetical protein